MGDDEEDCCEGEGLGTEDRERNSERFFRISSSEAILEERGGDEDGEEEENNEEDLRGG